MAILFAAAPQVPRPLKPQLYPNACSDLFSYEGKAETGQIGRGSTLTRNDPDVVPRNLAKSVQKEQ